MEEIKGKQTVTIQWIEEVKKMTQKPKGKKKSPSDSLDWRNKEVPLLGTAKITEGPTEDESPTTTDTDEIKECQGTLAMTMDEETTKISEKETITDILEEESTELTQASINVLAQLETDNSPLEELWINAKTNVSQKLAIQETADKKEKTLEEMVPQELLNYKDVFDKVMAEWFPESWPWDHAIDLKEDFVPLDCKVYPMTLPEQAELNKFINANLAKGYIRPSKSPMALPFFFVSKKDGKLCPCQDYQKLNEGTIKNSYPLPLISTLLDNLKGARYFTK